jgi:hypothetical protein
MSYVHSLAFVQLNLNSNFIDMFMYQSKKIAYLSQTSVEYEILIILAKSLIL